MTPELEPHYRPAGDEEEIIALAHAHQLPVMLLGPTGCGKTRLVERMAQHLGLPLVTVACHDDLTAGDLVGRYLVQGGDVTWIDGPLTRAVRAGAVCYLDEVIEARRDTLAVLHSLADHRRALFLERTGEVVVAPASFLLVCSYNPRARGAFKELRSSFRQRFVTVELDYLPPQVEAGVVAEETGVDPAVAQRLVAQAMVMREATERGSGEAPSTRLLVTCARLVAAGLDEFRALEVAALSPLAAPQAMSEAVKALVLAANGREGTNHGGFSR